MQTMLKKRGRPNMKTINFERVIKKFRRDAALEKEAEYGVD